jgi:hypothetical protein
VSKSRLWRAYKGAPFAGRNLGTFGPAGEAKSVLTGETLKSALVQQPERQKPSNHPGRPPSMRGRDTSCEICIVVGSDRSPTGERQVFIFSNLAAAHRAGFTWAI